MTSLASCQSKKHLQKSLFVLQLSQQYCAIIYHHTLATLAPTVPVRMCMVYYVIDIYKLLIRHYSVLSNVIHIALFSLLSFFNPFVRNACSYLLKSCLVIFHQMFFLLIVSLVINNVCLFQSLFCIIYSAFGSIGFL